MNNLSDGECNLQYIFYVQFLTNLGKEKTVLLEATTLTLTDSIISKVPAPGDTSLISAAPNRFNISAAHEFEAGSVMRVQPQMSQDLSGRPLPYQFYTVVLNKPTFIEEPGVLFFTLWTDPSQYIEPQHTDTAIENRRCAGIQEAARRLAMLVVEDKTNDSTRKLTREEHRELLSLWEEQYAQNMDF